LVSRRRSQFYCIYNLLVPGASAKIPADGIAYLGFVRLRRFIHQGMAGNKHAWGTVAALERMCFAEGVLDFGQTAALRRQTFHGGNGHPVGLHCEHAAGSDRIAVEQHRTGPADTMFASCVCARESQMITEEIDQCGARLYRLSPDQAIDFDLD